MSVKKLLKQGLDEEKKLLDMSGKKKGDNSETTILSEDSNSKKTSSEKNTKNVGGRPTFKSTGQTRRQQITITLLPEDYDRLKKIANSEGLSVARFLERSAFEYIKNHELQG